MREVLFGHQIFRAVVFVMRKEKHRTDCLDFARKLEAGGICCRFVEQSGMNDAEDSREGEVVLSKNRILVITDSSRTAEICESLEIACIGYRPADEGNGFFPHVRLVWESFEDRRPEDFNMLFQMESELDFPYSIKEEKVHSYREEKEKFCSYIENVYPFFGYGYWMVELAEQGRQGNVIGCCGLKDYDSSETEGYVVLMKESGRGISRESVTGSLCEPFRLELGYIVARPYRRQGYACEMCQAMLKHAFEVLNADAVMVRIHPQNIPSLKLARSLGFCLCGE